VRSDGVGRRQNLLIFGGLRICMVDFGWRASFGESTEEVGETQYSETGRQLFYPGKSGRLISRSLRKLLLNGGEPCHSR